MSEARPLRSPHKDDFIAIARIVKTQGRIGEVAAELFTDFPEKFAVRKRVFAVNEKGERCELQIDSFWPHKGWMVLKFKGVDSIDDAEALLKCELQIPFAERAELEAGSTYISDLVGCTVVDVASGQAVEVGKIKDVQFGFGEAPMLIVTQESASVNGIQSKEHLVPFTEHFLRKLDVAGKRIDMELPPGLLELDAPLSQEEKKQQHQKD